MRVLPAAELLDRWEAGMAQPRWKWAHALVCAAYPELDGTTVDALTIGQRDTRLLEIRESLFGPQLTGRSECPACHTAVELELSTADLRATPGSAASEVGRGVPAEPPRGSRPDPRLTGDLDKSEQVGSPYPQHSEVEPAVPGGLGHSGPQASPTGTPGSTWMPTFRLFADGCEIRFRVPTARDLADAANTPNPAALRAALLERCVYATRLDGQVVDLGNIPSAILDEIIAGMSAADPQADLRLQMSCPDCRHCWSETFDVVAYLWAELDAWAQRLLHDVHLLASVYGWSEAEVLALSAARRARYLEMISV